MDDAADHGAGAAAAGGGAAGAAAGSSGVGESACGLRGGLDPKLASRLGAEEEASAASPGGRSCWSRSREDEPLRMPRRLRMRSRNTTSFSGSSSLSARTCSSASCAASACRPSTRPCPARTDRDDGVTWAAAGDARSLSDPELSVRNMAFGFGRTAGARRRPGKGCLPEFEVARSPGRRVRRFEASKSTPAEWAAGPVARAVGPSPVARRLTPQHLAAPAAGWSRQAARGSQARPHARPGAGGAAPTRRAAWGRRAPGASRGAGRAGAPPAARPRGCSGSEPGSRRRRRLVLFKFIKTLPDLKGGR